MVSDFWDRLNLSHRQLHSNEANITTSSSLIMQVDYYHRPRAGSCYGCTLFIIGHVRLTWMHMQSFVEGETCCRSLQTAWGVPLSCDILVLTSQKYMQVCVRMWVSGLIQCRPLLFLPVAQVFTGVSVFQMYESDGSIIVYWQALHTPETPTGNFHPIYKYSISSNPHHCTQTQQYLCGTSECVTQGKPRAGNTCLVEYPSFLIPLN